MKAAARLAWTVAFALAACGPSAPPATTITAAPAPTARSAQRPTDAAIVDALDERLREDGDVYGSRLAASALDGVVTIAGSAPDVRRRERAVAIAETIRGVRAVVDEVVVEPANPRSDADIRADVTASLAIVPGLRGDRIAAEVAGGRVLLRGTASSWDLRKRAEDCARSVRGVRAVVDDIAVTPASSRSDGAIAQDATYRLAEDVWLEPSVVSASVQDGAVDLAGNVGSLAQKQRAIALAWVAGARAVDARNLVVDRALDARTPRAHEPLIRPDSEVRAAILHAIARDARIEHAATAVDAAVHEGIVTLTGTAPDAATRFAVQEDANDTVGVARVTDEVVLQPRVERADDAVARDVRDALARDPAWDIANGIEASVERGVVRLTGTIASPADRRELERVAWRVPGVRSVEDRLALEHPALAPPLEIRRRVLRALAWDGRLDASRIGVVVDAGGHTTLTGSVRTTGALRAALDDAVAVAGTDVTSRLHLE